MDNNKDNNNNRNFPSKLQIFLIFSVTFMIIGFIFFNKYVLSAGKIPIKKIYQEEIISIEPDVKTVTIYYTNDKLEKLTPLEVEIITEKFHIEIQEIFSKIKEVHNFAVKDESGEYIPFISEDTTLLDSFIVGNKLYLNISSHILNKAYTKRQEILLLYSIVNTYTSIEGINFVKILVNNQEIEKVKWYNLKNFYSKNTDI